MSRSSGQSPRPNSRDGRGECKQRDGFPLGYEVFDGNSVDVKTVERVVSSIESRFGAAGRVWEMDLGMTSEKNLEWLRSSGRQYLLGTPRSEMKRWARELAMEAGWRGLGNGLEVEQSRSKDRQSKEHAMRERATKIIRAELGSLGRRSNHAHRHVDRGSVDRQVDRILERHSRAARRFDVKVINDIRRKSEVRLAAMVGVDRRQLNPAHQRHDLDR